jgi:hypothetical protein
VSPRLPGLGEAERRLILDCARVELETPVARRIAETLRGPLAWDAIVAHAELHGVAPLLHHHLGGHLGRDLTGQGAGPAGPAAIPPWARQRLLRLSHRAAYRNLGFAEALAGVLDRLAEAGVPAVVLKGLSLVELVYGSPSLRPLIDLNLLVPRDRVETAAALLADRGYVPGVATAPALRPVAALPAPPGEAR